MTLTDKVFNQTWINIWHPVANLSPHGLPHYLPPFANNRYHRHSDLFIQVHRTINHSLETNCQCRGV